MLSLIHYEHIINITIALSSFCTFVFNIEDILMFFKLKEYNAYIRGWLINEYSPC